MISGFSFYGGKTQIPVKFPRKSYQTGEFQAKDLDMPKQTSPRKSKKRIRRRIECSRCGKSYSYSGPRSHSCGDDAPESDETAFDLFDSLNVSSDVRSDITAGMLTQDLTLNPRGGYSLIWPMRGCADGQVMVFGLSVLNRVCDFVRDCPRQGI